MLNKIFLIGNLGKEVESRMTTNGKQVANFSLATKSGKDNTEWHNIVCFEKLAELATKYLHKGSKVFVEGTIKYEQSEKDGVKKLFTKIIANHITFLDSKQSDDLPTDNDIGF